MRVLSVVANGQVRAFDRYSNTRADEAADFGRRRVWPEVADARRNLSGVCRRWYRVVLQKPSLVLSSIVMTLLVWLLILLFGLLGAFLRGAVLLMLFGMLLCFQVLFIFGILVGLVFLLLFLLLRISVVGRTLLISWSSWLLFLGSLHWPFVGADLGPGGISYVELLILNELRAGERFQFEKAVPRSG